MASEKVTMRDFRSFIGAHPWSRPETEACTRTCVARAFGVPDRISSFRARACSSTEVLLSDLPLVPVALAEQIDYLRTIGGVVVERQVAGSFPHPSRLKGNADSACAVRSQTGAAGIGLREVASNRHRIEFHHCRAVVDHFQRPGRTSSANSLSTEFQVDR
jgi:hypothetical protein